MIDSLYLGKETEMRVVAKLLDAKREVYLPAVDDQGIDIIVRTKKAEMENKNINDEQFPEGCNQFDYQEIQVKSLSKGGLFAALKVKPRPNYWFVFYVKELDTFWLIHSSEVCALGSVNVKGKNQGKYSISLARNKKAIGKMQKYITTDFSQLP